MKHRSPPINAANPFLAWTTLALKTNEMLLASVQVISHRSNRIAKAGILPSARDQQEFALMGQEKIEAAAESAQAIASRIMTINQQLGTMIFKQLISGTSGFVSLAFQPAFALSGKQQAKLLRAAMQNSTAVASKLAGSVAHLAHHGLKPIHSRATGNAKRLQKLAESKQD
jgi:hypothetical protein